MTLSKVAEAFEYAISELNLSSDDLELSQKILIYLASNNLLTARKAEYLEYMNKHFTRQKLISETIFDQFELFALSEPEKILDLGRKSIFGFQTLNHLLMIHTSNPEKSIAEKIKYINAYWECYRMVSSSVPFLTGHKVKDTHLSSPQSAFKHLIKHFGFKKSDIEVIRLLRNSGSHLLTLGNESLILKETIDGERKEIKIESINEIYEKLGQIYSWWATTFISLIYFQPKYGLLLLVGTYSAATKSEEGTFVNWYKTMAMINPTLVPTPQPIVAEGLFPKDIDTQFLIDSKILSKKDFLNLDMSQRRDIFMKQLCAIGFLGINQLKNLRQYIDEILPKLSEDSKDHFIKINNFVNMTSSVLENKLPDFRTSLANNPKEALEELIAQISF